MSNHVLLEGDIFSILPDLPANFYDACLCDPPYFLEFMGKDFDRQHKLRPGANDGQRMQAWHTEWAREVYRVLKPGAFVVAFGGTRTYHRLAAAFEDVGFEMRDCLMWLYGSGFPKSLDISKAIDKTRGAKFTSSPAGGVGFMRPDGGRGYNVTKNRLTRSGDSLAPEWAGYGTSLKPAWEPIILAMRPCEGTFAGNALRHGVAGINIDGGRISGPKAGGSGQAPLQFGGTNHRPFHDTNKPRDFDVSNGRWPANLLLSHHDSCLESECHPLCPVRMLDDQTGHTKSGTQTRPNPRAGGIWKTNKGMAPEGPQYGDSGGASRFFYTAKVSTRERNLGLPPGEVCSHPTLKPISVCRYLATLLLPPARPNSRATPRSLLIPFSGAGSEVAGSLLAGWDEVTGIERDPEYIRWAEMRVRGALNRHDKRMN